VIIVVIGLDINSDSTSLPTTPTTVKLSATLSGSDRYEAIRKNAFCVFIEMIIAIIYHKGDCQ
jgi:hypothetical protein